MFGFGDFFVDTLGLLFSVLGGWSAGGWDGLVLWGGCHCIMGGVWAVQFF